MRNLLLICVCFQLWQTYGDLKKIPKPRVVRIEPAKTNNGSNRRVYRRYFGSNYPSPPYTYAPLMIRAAERPTTTTRKYFSSDCDYINYYCLKGFSTARICAKTVYNSYETFENYCEVDFVNCEEGYDVWNIAHMGHCYNVTQFQTFSYYAYAIWNDEKLEELYVMPQI